MTKYFDLDDNGKRLFIEQTAIHVGLPKTVVEKDLWVTLMLQVVFQLPFADKLVFKGGSSLSKVWGLINRMSEDIDLAYGDNFGTFNGDSPTIKQIKKLRKASSVFVRTEFCDSLREAIVRLGLDAWCNVEPQEDGEGDNTYPEPRQVYVTYKSLFPEENGQITSEYIKPTVMLEVSARSLMEPHADATVNSMLSEAYPQVDTQILQSNIRTALPAKTFLEKAFLLHELFSTDRCANANRKSRHLYDLERMMDEPFAREAVTDDALWQSISHHRKHYTSMKGIDYDTDIRKVITLLPPEEYLSAWEQDYNIMREKMILAGNAIPFNQMLERMTELQARFRR